MAQNSEKVRKAQWTILAVGVALMLIPSAAFAQWSSDPATNLLIADAEGSEVRAKVAPAPGGGAYVTWIRFNSRGSEVRLQILDSEGNSTRPQGKQIEQRVLGSTQNYGLSVAADGNALITYRVRKRQKDKIQIGASKMLPDGGRAWEEKVTVSNTTAFVAAPKIVGTSDGGAVVAWIEALGTRLQKLDSDGNPLWGDGVFISLPSFSVHLADLHASGNDVIASFVRFGAEFGAPRQLTAQKLDGDGNPLWGADPIEVYASTGKLQFGYFPPFAPDGAGGAVFAWYQIDGAQLNVAAQHILADGSEAFPHNGVLASTDADGGDRKWPSASYDSATGEVYVFWSEQNNVPDEYGIYGQKFDSAGNRLWADTGAVIAPLSPGVTSEALHVQSGAGAMVFWRKMTSLTDYEYHGAHVTPAGVVDIPRFDLATSAGVKGGLAVAQTTNGVSVLAWSDARSGVDSAIYAQNVNPDGSLGE